MPIKKFIKLGFFRFFPPTWLWLRSGFFFFIGVFLFFFSDKTISKILIIISLVHLGQYSLTMFFQVLDRKLKIFFGIQQLKTKNKKIFKN
jgi:predicted membrane protein